MSVLGYWSNADWRAYASVEIRVAVIAFHHSPTIVSAICDNVDFFPRALSYISGVELTCAAIKRKTEWVAHANRENLISSWRLPEERVRRRRRIVQLSVWVVDVNSQDLAKEVVDVLRVIVRVIC